MPLGLFHSRTFGGANLLTLLLYASLSGTLFFLPFNLIQIHGDFGVAPIPIDSRISISLTNTDAVNLYACRDTDFSGGYFTRACGLAPSVCRYAVSRAVSIASTTVSKEISFSRSMARNAAMSTFTSRPPPG